MSIEVERTWHRLDGLQVGKYTLSLGFYGSGRFALQAIGADGIPECTITVNLEEEPLEPNEFHVRFETRRYSPDLFEALMASGIAEPTGTEVSAGFVERYAEVWKLNLPEGTQ